uniref:Chromodomain helicase DNA binding protein 6 n=1 Tax=Catharus ustulatus TaxID=91951 RepID=A0A8C3UUH1_CATUS
LTVSLLGSKDTPVEKKKKGKRKNEIPLNSLDLDQDLLSPSVQSPEESAESADSQVCPKPSAVPLPHVLGTDGALWVRMEISATQGVPVLPTTPILLWQGRAWKEFWQPWGFPSATQARRGTFSFCIQKRRSGRQVKRRKYNEDLDFKVVDDDGETIAVLGAGRTSALSASTLAWQAEVVLGVGLRAGGDLPHAGYPKMSVLRLEEMVEEFYVKYRNFSYLHCKWATLEELEKDPRISQKIKRFRNKQAQMKHIFTEPDEDLFNPDYVEVDRILEVAHTKDPDTGEVTHYLVKWCSLPYEESTWELEEDVDPGKIKEFEALQIPPEIKHMERPASESWQKLEKSREYKNSNQLREYQLEGMNWLLFNWYNRKNCILADEMGLGKTIQSITFLSEIFLMGIHGPFLIIAPLSTITNWEREFRTWTEMNAIVYHGSQISRQMIQQYEMVYRDTQGNPLPGIFKFQVVITTFEMILADCPELKKIQWRCVVIDEAHRLKNRNCKLLEGLKLMALEHKVLLTGTPLQNSVEELFSLLNFLEPQQFPSETAFLEEFGDLKTEEQVKKLQSILKPMMLRRLKDDVEKNLAPKQETIIEVELTNIQKKYYRAILEKNFSFLSKGANQHNMPNLINTMMELRKCCNHPYLINGAEEKILEDFRKTHCPEAPDFQLQAMIQAAGKLVLIDKLLPKLIAGGHKVLIFSQMVRCLDILEDYLIQRRRYTYERIDGRVRGNLRQAAIDRFCKPDSDRFVFLLCTRAGGLGINLTAADTCIIFDSDWNPQNDLQAQARCHRIGQSKAVKVYRLITRNSYEREMFDKASLKLGLDKAVLQDINRKGSTNGVQQLSKMEVEDLLRKGAYGALMDEEDEGSKFCEEDIDQILQRRTQTITIQSEGKGSTFAKASFVASGNRTDISLDDPNFWQKWAKIAELDTDAKNEKESLVIDRPRVRKQTKHYNSFEEDELMEFSELDSDSDERPTRSRRFNEKTRRYLRAECFRVEKNLLIFGWGRWKDILTHGRFKWHLNEKDMEMICRALLVYCVKHYKGDEKIKSFIWDLITPTKDGQNQALQNHSGLSAPVPRGRKGKKTKNQMLLPEIKNADWLATCNPEVVLHDDSYKKHLKQHCNKVLLRVRMLYYLKAEVLGEAADKAFEGTPARELDVLLPDIDYVEIPVDWWNAEADKSLLIGVFKHGYERYNAMRADPALCFLEKVGMPDEKLLSAEQAGDGTESCWPVSSALTARLRRLVTVYQRCNRKELPPRTEMLVPGNHGYWLQDEMFRRASEMDSMNKEMQKRWTRREQADFYRTVSSFGVIYDQEKKIFDWTQFRAISRLEKKTDESLEKYFYSFVAMCKNVCGLPLWKEDGPPDPDIYVEPITEERAARTLYRIELLRKVREQVLKCPQLQERLKLCRPSLYLPVWWECGKHDRDLLIGTAKHGLNRTDYYIMNDPQLSFLDAYRNYAQHKRTGLPGPETLCCLYQSNSKLYSSPIEEAEPSPSTPESNPSQSAPTNLGKGLEQKEALARLEAKLGPSQSHSEEDEEEEEDDDNSEAAADAVEGLNGPRTRADCDPEAHELGGVEQSSGLPTPEDTCPEDINGERDSLGLGEPRLATVQFCLQDRVIINRIDNICHAILKGKWPSSSQQFESQSLLTTPAMTSNTGSRSNFTDSEAPDPSFNNGVLMSRVQKVRGHRRPYEFEMERDAKQRSLEQLAAAHVHPPIVLNGWREAAVDLSRASDGSPGNPSPFPLNTNMPKLGTVNALQSSLGMDLSGILQAGLIHPVTGQIVNGSLRRDDAAMRRRRGRRKNVEGMDLIFLKERPLPNRLQDVQEDQPQPPQNSPLPDGPVAATSTPQPVPAASSQEKAVPNKSLLDWLRQQSDYTLDVPSFGTVRVAFSDKPKQRRQRCKDPNKLDISSLTGEERVPVVHKGTGRRLGGATAPALKELPRWLDANLEYAVAADWADIVKLSGYLPENKFNRILTEPVLRDTGPRRRGRRPRSELLKGPGVVADSSSGMGPLFMNGLIAGMDLVGLQNMRNMQGIPLTGLVGFPAGFAAVPAGEDVKSTLSMLPMMLPGMATVPQMFGVGGLLNSPMTTTCTATAPTSLTSTTKGGTASAEKANEEKRSSQDGKKEPLTEDKPGPSSFSNQTESAITTSSPVAFNPFLIPGMSPGLIYPSMFLSPGIGMALPGIQQTRHSEAANLESQKRKRKKVKGESANPEPETVSLPEKEAANSQNCVEQSPPAAAEKEQDGPAEEERQAAHDTD